jgi:hypothetical protein
MPRYSNDHTEEPFAVVSELVAAALCASASLRLCVKFLSARFRRPEIVIEFLAAKGYG